MVISAAVAITTSIRSYIVSVFIIREFLLVRLAGLEPATKGL